MMASICLLNSVVMQCPMPAAHLRCMLAGRCALSKNRAFLGAWCVQKMLPLPFGETTWAQEYKK